MDKNSTNLKISVGIGCKKGVSFTEIIAALEHVFKTAEMSGKYDFTFIACLSSIDIKRNEQGLLKLGQKLNKEFKFYSADILKFVPVSDKSEFVNSITGTYSVAEAAAILSSKNKTLIVQKHKFGNITIAIAE
jgi:cobalt-precorrin 5A hydrolase